MAERTRATESLARGRAALAAGRTGRAVHHAWDAASQAVRTGDAETLAAARLVAEEASARTTGRAKQRADQAAAYCRHALDQQEAGVKPVTLLSMVFSRRREAVKHCPDCAEKIRAEAVVCRYCGYRYEQPAGG